VRDSDGTLVLTRSAPRGGTALTVAVAHRLGKTVLVVDLERRAGCAEVREWIERERIEVLNVAGPRESEAPGIHDQAAAFLRLVLRGA
jgi:hypothetical protein